MNRMAVQQSVEEVAVIIQNILKQVQIEEPRFTCTLNKTVNGRYDGRLSYSYLGFHNVWLWYSYFSYFGILAIRACIKKCNY